MNIYFLFVCVLLFCFSSCTKENSKKKASIPIPVQTETSNPISNTTEQPKIETIPVNNVDTTSLQILSKTSYLESSKTTDEEATALFKQTRIPLNQ